MKSDKIASALDVPLPLDYQVFVDEFAPRCFSQTEPGIYIQFLDADDSFGVIGLSMKNRTCDVPHDFVQISYAPWGGLYMLDTGEGVEGEIRLWDSMTEGPNPESWEIVARSFTQLLEHLLYDEVPIKPLDTDSRRDLEQIIRRLKG